MASIVYAASPAEQRQQLASGMDRLPEDADRVVLAQIKQMLAELPRQ